MVGKNIINVLPAHMADMIAAGEVVERPASVVKELLENCIDAGSTSCTVEIEKGGTTFIRVADNGCGMSREDAQTAFLRHATSKIKVKEDLQSISTLGFRGEALAAISAVSRVEMFTRREDDDEGTVVTVDAGKVTSCESAGCPKGTTMIVRDLFYNTPARLKFMKKDTAEASAVRLSVVNAALSHPEVAIKYIRDGETEIQTAGDGSTENCVYSVLGRDFALSLVKVKASVEHSTKVEGFISKPGACRGNRTMQHFFVNGRYIKSQALAASLEAAYRNRTMIGKFPGCVLFINLPVDQLDVNVHPAKTEVRFVNSKLVCDAVYAAADLGLSREEEKLRSAPERKQTAPVHFTDRDRLESFGRLQPLAREVRQDIPSWKAGREKTGAPSGAESRREMPGMTRAMPWDTAGERSFSQTKITEPVYGRTPDKAEKPERTADSIRDPQAAEDIVEPVQQSMKMPEARNWRVAGEVFKTYIIVEWADKVILIDKHAAHERMLFDKIKAQVGSIMSQQLLMPLTLRPESAVAEALLGNADLLREFGFEIEDFGAGSIAVRACPSDIGEDEVIPSLEEIGSEIAERGSADVEYARNKVLSTVACKAAIKAGMNNNIRELERVAEKVISGEVVYCPHGRPVSMEVSKYRLDKIFGRV